MSKQSKEKGGTVLFPKSPKRKQESLLRQSLLNSFESRISKTNSPAKHKEKEKVHRRTSDSSEIGERPRACSFPSEKGLRQYLGPIDECLVENAEISQRNRRRQTDGRRHSIHLCSSDLRDFGGESRSKTMALPRYFLTKQARRQFHFVHCKWYEPMELPSATDKESNEETYIDENGIYTTVLCFTEI